ncbi:hypothetical protein FKM82_005089 [Ascaphus truei]
MHFTADPQGFNRGDLCGALQAPLAAKGLKEWRNALCNALGCFVLSGSGGKSKGSGRQSSRKAKSPAPGQPSGERPPSASSVHSEGDCNRKTPLTNRVWEERPSSTGSTPFPYNPLTIRLPTGLAAAPSSASIPQSNPGPPQRPRDEEPKPLLCSQYETLSDSE